MTQQQTPRGDPARDRADAPRARRDRRRAVAQGRREGAGPDQEGRGQQRVKAQTRCRSPRDRRRRSRLLLLAAFLTEALTAMALPRDRAPDEPDRPGRPRLVGRAEAHGQGVQGGQPDRLGGRADLLRRARDLPGADRAGLDPRAGRRVRDAAADRQPRQVAPGPAKEIFTSAIENLQGDQGAAGVLFIVGLLGALWSASGYVGGVHARVERDLRHRGGRPIWKTAAGARGASRWSCWCCWPSPRWPWC